MVEKLIGWCAKHKFAVLLLTGVWVCYGIWTLGHQTIDAIPDLSDTQVIIYSKWDRSPDLIEAQVTYPIASALLGAPKLKAIRGYLILDSPTFMFSSRMGQTSTGHEVVSWNT
jgi:Cu(I)/Ag(I) efflux system membrane protein CusA/SilA